MRWAVMSQVIDALLFVLPSSPRDTAAEIARPLNEDSVEAHPHQRLQTWSWVARVPDREKRELAIQGF